MPYANPHSEHARMVKKENAARWWRGNREKRRQIVRQYQEREVAKLLHARAKVRAAKYGIEFSIEVCDVIVPLVCPILEIPLRRNVGGKIAANGSPSIDRIDPKIGYVAGNVWVISSLANRMKNNAQRDDLIRFARWVLERMDARLT